MGDFNVNIRCHTVSLIFFAIYIKIDANCDLRFEICEFRNYNEKIMFQRAKSATCMKI